MGAASVEKLERAGIRSVADFVAMPADKVRKLLTVTGQRTHELRGFPCYPFSPNPPTRKTIAVTRNFGRAITAMPEMREAIATYATRR